MPLGSGNSMNELYHCRKIISLYLKKERNTKKLLKNVAIIT